MSVFVFTSPACKPCQELKPTIRDLKEEFPDLKWTDVNIKEDPTGITQKYGVKFVPTIVVDSPKGVTSHTGKDATGYYRILKNA